MHVHIIEYTILFCLGISFHVLGTSHTHVVVKLISASKKLKIQAKEGWIRSTIYMYMYTCSFIVM